MPRNTIQKSMVLEAVRQLKHHPTADDIYDCIKERCPGISKATVYRNLATLASNGEILRVSHLNAADCFDFNTAPHYHFRCRGCGKVFDTPVPYNHSLHSGANIPHGFLYEGHCTTFTGLCPCCAVT